MRQSHPIPNSAPFALKLLGLSRRIASIFTGIFEGVQSAVFMGLIDDEVFQNWDSYPHHDNLADARSLDSVEMGFEKWEQDLVENHASHHGSSLVIGAGGGREAFALKKRGSHVEGIEYNFQLASATRDIFNNMAIEIPVWHQSRFEIPEPSEPYDTVFIARLYLSYIHDRHRRIEFLKRIHAVLKSDGVLIFGYFTRPENPRANLSRSFRLQALLANFIRTLRRCRKSFPVEVGDHLDPHIPLYHHHYIGAEVTSELKEAGFDIIESGQSWFGWTAASPTKVSNKKSGRSKPDLELAAQI